MSRRPPNPSAERAAQNQQALKTLVKIESNKSCADCKKNKHPRWASWNLGIFICIRCSGIHRGMGTHISRVKSVDLDSWTDEQLQSMLKWGNARANKYWEAKLAQGHVPAEAKIENFIRTKYDSKRWVMDGGIPDPATLDDEGDSEVPSNAIQETARAQAGATARAPLTSAQPPPISKKPNQDVDLFGGDPLPLPPKSSASALPAPPAQSRPEVATPRVAKPADSLLGFDFFNAQTTPPSRPASTGPSVTASTTTSRPDLKQSILSLYARPPSVPQSQPAFSAPPVQPAASNGLDDAFSSLSFSSAPAQAPTSVTRAQPAAPSMTTQRATAVSPVITSPINMHSGGSFFDPKPVSSTTYERHTTFQSPTSPSDGFGGFSSNLAPVKSVPMQSASNNGLDDLLGFSTMSAQPAVAPKPATSPISSPFNLSQKPTQQAKTNSTSIAPAADLSNPWGSSAETAWSTPSAAPTAASMASVPAKPAAPTRQESDWGWSSNTGPSATTSAPQVAGDDDFGGWEGNTTAASTQAAPVKNTKPGGFGGGEDLFSNVWE